MSSNKRKLRQEVRKTLSTISAKSLQEQSQQLVEVLQDWLNDNPDVTKVAIYAALPLEVNLQGITELLPKIEWHYPLVGRTQMTFHRVSDPRSLQKGIFDIPEPNPQVHPPVIASNLDLIICPGLAFTNDGVRLGRGGGFYDRLLATATEPLRMGACLTEQTFPTLPSESHDIKMNLILSSGQISHAEPSSSEFA